MRSPTAFVIVPLLAMLCLGGAAASAENLLVNPSFDTDGAGWGLFDNDQMVVSYRADVGSTLAGGSIVFEADASASYLGYTSTVDQLSGDAVYNAAR